MADIKDVLRFIGPQIYRYPSGEHLFNQYRNITEYCRPHANELRWANLGAYLSWLDDPDVLMVGEAPGPWGARLSGVPFTSELQLTEGCLGYPLPRTTKTQNPFGEHTADIVWDEIGDDMPRIFMWNVIPWHPQAIDNADGIRKPWPKEYNAALPMLKGIWRLLRPRRVVAVGRVAEKILNRFCDPVYIRHPSHGGEHLFRQGIQELFGR